MTPEARSHGWETVEPFTKVQNAEGDITLLRSLLLFCGTDLYRLVQMGSLILWLLFGFEWAGMDGRDGRQGER